VNLQHGKWYFEIVAKSACAAKIGWAIHGFIPCQTVLGKLGDTQDSWGFDCLGGKLLVGGTSRRWRPIEPKRDSKKAGGKENDSKTDKESSALHASQAGSMEAAGGGGNGKLVDQVRVKAQSGSKAQASGTPKPEAADPSKGSGVPADTGNDEAEKEEKQDPPAIWKKWSLGDVITVMIDVDAGEMRFVFNGDFGDKLKRMVVANVYHEPGKNAALEEDVGESGEEGLFERIRAHEKSLPFSNLFPVVEACSSVFEAHVRFGGLSGDISFVPPHSAGYRPLAESLHGSGPVDCSSAKKSEASESEFEAAADRIRVWLGSRSRPEVKLG